MLLDGLLQIRRGERQCARQREPQADYDERSPADQLTDPPENSWGSYSITPSSPNSASVSASNSTSTGFHSSAPG